MATEPLSGIRILDLTNVLAGPYCCFQLAMMGAEVIKVENPDGGDPARRWGPPISEGNSIIFQAVNRDKRSVTVDLQTQFIGAGDAERPLDSVVEVLRETRRLAFLRGLVVQDDDLVASFAGTVRKPTRT